MTKVHAEGLEAEDGGQLQYSDIPCRPIAMGSGWGLRELQGTKAHEEDLTGLWSTLKTTGKSVGAGSDAVRVLFERNLVWKDNWGRSRTWVCNTDQRSKADSSY